MREVRTFHVESVAQRERLGQFLEKRDPPFQVEYGPIREQRSLAANSRLWKLHSLAASHTGNSAEDMHEEALCRHFGYTEHKMPTGWIKRVPIKRSSAREPKEFSEFMEATEAWYAQEFGVWLD